MTIPLTLALFVAVAAADPARELAPLPAPDLAGYRTLDQAQTATIRPAPPGREGQTGYLGCAVRRDEQGRLAVEEVQPGSPADRAGLRKGDLVLRVAGREARTPDAFRDLLQVHGPVETVVLSVRRGAESLDLKAALAAYSRPRQAAAGRAYIGVEMGDDETEGVRVRRVLPGAPAAAAGLKDGDLLVRLDGQDFRRAAALTDMLSGKRPGEPLTLTVRRDGKDVELKATLASPPRERGPQGPWAKPVFRLAVVPFEFPDVKHDAAATPAEWDKLVFGKGAPPAPEPPASLADYLRENSAGALKLDGRAFAWVEVAKKQGDYVQGSGTSNRTAPLTDALDKLVARDGKDILRDFDGLLLVYAGRRVPGNRGSVFSPHAGSLAHQNRRLPYLLVADGGSRRTTLGGLVKEMGQVLGLPDLAARPENPGSEGLGPWCALSDPIDGRPQHYGAWAKEHMGWLKPVVLDPTVPQKLILAPVENSPRECLKLLVRPDGSEYFLLENRKKQGFDQALPAEGLLIWRVLAGRPILEESHGVTGPSGPRVHPASVPYPSPANDAFTPDTTPSSRSPQGGGLPVHLTNIRRLPDGRVALQVGYEYR